jgi:hypothetical protein
MKSQPNCSWLIVRLLAVVLLTTTSVFSQSKERIVQWSKTPISDRNTKGSGQLEVLPQIEALEIRAITVGGKSVAIDESFAAGDEWLESLTVRVKNVSSHSVSKVQLDLFLPEIMPGGPLVTLCYGCGGVANGQSIMAGEEVDMKIVFYSWLVGQINARSSLSNITRAEIQNTLLTLENGRRVISGCVRTASLKNACPTPAP